MQPLNCFAKTPATAGEKAEFSQEKKSGTPSAPDEFNALMQRALAPKPKDSPRAAALRPAKNNSPPDPNPISNETSSPGTAEKSGADKTAAGVDKTGKAEAKNPPEQNPADALVSTPPDSSDLLPLPLPLPAAAVFVSPQTATGFLASAKAKSGVTAISANESATGAGASAAEISKSDLSATEKNKSLVEELSPTKTGDVVTGAISNSLKPAAFPNEAPAAAADLLKNAAALSEKNAAATEITQPPTLSAAEPKAAEVMATTALHAAEKDGTGVATVGLPMKKSANTNKVAGLDGKVLPGDVKVTAAEKVLPAVPAPGPVRLAEGTASNLNLVLPDALPAVDFSAAQGALGLPALTDAKMRNLERTQEMVTLHAVRLMESPSDMLQVVIKPGAGTELSLQLRQRDGGIEAQATLQRGDFQLMNQHWPELQQRLEQRGIKLAPLGGEANFSADSGGSFNQQQQSSSRELEAQKASAFAEFAVASRMVGATARLAIGGISGGGWESWA
jgi:hypothetical protein